MGLFQKLFAKKETETPINTYADFWAWFATKQKDFYEVVKQRGNIEQDFFNQLSPKLNELKSGFFYLTGMYDDNTVELVFTADGNIKNMVFVEELVAEAPALTGWKFTAHKQAMDISNLGIKMGAYEFSANTLSFYANTHEQYPDEIDITLVYKNYKEEDRNLILNGSITFLDNYLGDLDSVINIDSLSVVGAADATQELIPLDKLKDYLNWRQKEFIEKYQGVLHDTENSNYSAMEATLENGNPLFAVINTEVLDWKNKASHPWILDVGIKYDGQNNNGLPDEPTYKLLDEIEDRIIAQLKDFEGYLNIGRETADGLRTIYFACKEFRKPSKVLFEVQKQYAGQLQVDYDIFKDKYWQIFEKYK